MAMSADPRDFGTIDLRRKSKFLNDEFWNDHMAENMDQYAQTRGRCHAGVDERPG